MFSCKIVTYCNTVFASDTSLAIAFASPLSYFTCLKYTVQSSHSLVLYLQSSTFCVDPSSACDTSSCSSASLPTSPSYPSISLVHRSNLLCPQSSTFCADPSSACDASSSSSTSASSPSSPSYPSTSLVPRSHLSSPVTARHRWLAVGMALLSSPSSSKSPLTPGLPKCRCNCCLSGCLGQCFRSHVPQPPLRRSNSQEE